MKRIFKFIYIALIGVIGVTSCNMNEYPKFDDKNAFVAFDVQSLSANEDVKTISIPVTLASVKGISSSVTYEVVEGTAKEGIDYTLTDGAATLNFDSNNRTQNIVINIIERAGLFTGDLKFSIKFKSTGNVADGEANTCTITIKDKDHPLAAILGKYTAKGVSYFAGKEITWTMTIRKDASDVTKVWIYNFFGNDGWADDDMLVYGVVNEDKTIITVPFGQASEYIYKNGSPVYFYGMDADLNGYDAGEGNWNIKILNNGANLDFGEYGIWAQIGGTGGGAISVIMPGITATKQ